MPRGKVLTAKLFCFSLKTLKIHEPLNQNQACLYLFECIFNGDSKYINEYQWFWNSFAHDARHVVKVLTGGVMWIQFPKSLNYTIVKIT